MIIRVSKLVGINEKMVRTAAALALCTSFCFFTLKDLCTENDDWQHGPSMFLTFQKEIFNDYLTEGIAFCNFPD